jgi:ArsR family transcriptional regulator, arsenate/arsenite/antimonite-responsive transcriptional repressor
MMTSPHICQSKYILVAHIRQGVYHGDVGRSSQNRDLALLFAALADRTRLRLLNLMDGREVCVCYFVEILGQSQPKISRHLAYLRRAGIVEARREGKWMHYRIMVPTHPGAARVLQETLSALREEKGMQGDVDRLNRACCAPEKLSALQAAPRPVPADALFQR